jgi:antitoxin (DNA-binding transcriptional repressor) of toxin-antitoxin stability system
MAALGEDFSRISSVSLPMGAWSGDDVSVTYRSESVDDVVTVRAQRPDSWTILLVSRGPERALEALSENLDWIWSELSIPADEFLLL